MKKGFTLIELLVVVAIIGGLSALLLPNFMGARERTRDSQRKSDLKQLQKSLELYKQDQSPPSYPDTLPAPGSKWSSPTNVVYMNKIPGDPLDATRKYYYDPDNTDLTYTLTGCIENNADTAGELCPSDFESVSGYACPTNKCYIVNEP